MAQSGFVGIQVTAQWLLPTGYLHLVPEEGSGQRSVARHGPPTYRSPPLAGPSRSTQGSDGTPTRSSPLWSSYKGSPPVFCPPLKPKLTSDAMFLSFSSSPSTTTAAAASTTNSYDDSVLHHQLFFSAASPHGHYHEDGINGGFIPFPSSFPSEHYLRRSSSTHSLALHQYTPESVNQQAPPPPPLPTLQYSSSPSSSCDYLDFNAGPVRRVLSTGDLQGTNAMLENYGQEGGGAPGRVARYSAEERKERIERYRSKRNQRNFHKKITYACRKTLADSRPRVRGRFARNGETETEAETSETATTNGFSCYNACGGNGSDWWSQLQVDDEDDRFYDGDVLVSFADDDGFSRNILF